MSAQFTPGPWYVRDTRDFNYPRIEILRDVVYANGCRPTTYLIGSVTYPTTSDYPVATVGSEERAANARLIAAAPELYAALGALLAEVTTPADQWAEGSAVNRARAALSLAGQQGQKT